MARAFGSYPKCHRFESSRRYHGPVGQSPWRVGQAAKTPPFHGGNTGSIPVRVTTDGRNRSRSYGGLAQLVRAPASHAGGHWFESSSLHQSNIIRTCSPSGTGSGLLFIWTIFLYNKTALATFGRGRYSLSNLVSILIQHPFQQSIQHSFHALLSNVQTPCVPLGCRRTPGALGADNAPLLLSQSLVSPSAGLLRTLVQAFRTPPSLSVSIFAVFKRWRLRTLIL